MKIEKLTGLGGPRHRFAVYFEREIQQWDVTFSVDLCDPVWLSEVACCEISGSEKAWNFLITYNFIDFARFALLHVGGAINLLNTKRRRLYLKTHFVPRSKHFSSRL